MKSKLSFYAVIPCSFGVCDPTIEDALLDENNNSAKRLGYLPDLWSEK